MTSEPEQNETPTQGCGDLGPDTAHPEGIDGQVKVLHR